MFINRPHSLRRIVFLGMKEVLQEIKLHGIIGHMSWKVRITKVTILSIEIILIKLLDSILIFIHWNLYIKFLQTGCEISNFSIKSQNITGRKEFPLIQNHKINSCNNTLKMVLLKIFKLFIVKITSIDIKVCVNILTDLWTIFKKVFCFHQNINYLSNYMITVIHIIM